MKEEKSAEKILHIQKCFEIDHEVQKASILFKCPANEVCFEVLNVLTFLEGEDGERRELSPQECEEFFASGRYESEICGVTQAYDIALWREKKEWEIDLELLMQNAVLLLVCQENDYEVLLGNLKEVHRQINAKKARLGVIFKEFSLECDEVGLRSKLAKIYDAFGGMKKILLEKSEFYYPAFDSYFFFTLEKEWELKNGKILENSSYAVRSGEEVGKLIVGNRGNDGRDLLGEYQRVTKKEMGSDEFGGLAEDFSHEEFEGRVVYRALKDGFVGINGSGLILVKDVSFEEINHRNIGNLLGGVEKDFEIEVKASSPERDAIGAGIVLESKKIKVNGGVDQGVVLRAKECKIEGLTHQGAEIYADQVEISTHKGKLQANQAVIRLCEGGVVDCESGTIEELVGSEISCKNAHIQNLRANNKISFCQTLEIDSVMGGNNSFRIDSSAFYEYRDKVNAIQQRYQKHLAFIEEALKIYRQELNKVSKMKSAVVRFKNIFLKNVKQGVSTQQYIIDTIKQYTQMCEKLQLIKEKIQAHQKKSEEIKQELAPIAHLCVQAKLICKSAWVDQNQVEYFDVYQNHKECLMIENGEEVNIMIDSVHHQLMKERVAR